MAKENMSKLERLIQQYCPDGVEYVPLSSIGTIKRGNGLQKKDFVKAGIGCIHYGQIYTKFGLFTNKTLTYVDKELADHLLHIEKGDLVIACTSENVEDVCKAVAWLGDDSIVTGGHSCVLHHNQNPKYIAYFFQTESFQRQKRKYAYGTKVIDIKPDSIGKIEIPLPPLPVQEEIVRILDAFTELQAELQAELQKRLQQYEYYKWNIFEGLSCPTKHITDVALVKARVGWQRLTTAEYQETGDYYLITGTDFKNGKIDFNSCVFVSKERYEMDPNIIVGKGDILITKDGTLGKVAFMAEEPNKPTTLNSGVFRIHTTDLQVSSRYLFHYFTSKYFTDFVNSVKTGSTIPHLTQQGLVSLNIPIPSLEEQNRVVSILDRFDTLTTDLTQGLPAEIEKHRQQYEYYRDKLLTFRRKGA